MAKRIVLLVAVLLLGLGVIHCQKPVDMEAEKTAIKQVLENMTKEYDKKSFEGWANYIVHEPYALHAWANKNEHVENKGWDEISALWKKRFERRLEKDPKPSKSDFVFENFTFKIWRDAAWVTYDSYSKEVKEKNPDYIPWKTYCVFEKTKDGWKWVSWVNIPRNSWRESEPEQ